MAEKQLQPGDNERPGENQTQIVNPEQSLHFFDQKIREGVGKIVSIGHEDPSTLIDLNTGRLWCWNPVEKRHSDIMSENNLQEGETLSGFCEKTGGKPGDGIKSINFFTPMAKINRKDAGQAARTSIIKILKAMKSYGLDESTEVSIIISSKTPGENQEKLEPKKIFPEFTQMNPAASRGTLGAATQLF